MNPKVLIRASNGMVISPGNKGVEVFQYRDLVCSMGRRFGGMGVKGSIIENESGLNPFSKMRKARKGHGKAILLRLEESIEAWSWRLRWL